MSAAAVAALTAYALGVAFTLMAGISSHAQDFPTPPADRAHHHGPSPGVAHPVARPDPPGKRETMTTTDRADFPRA